MKAILDKMIAKLSPTEALAGGQRNEPYLEFLLPSAALTAGHWPSWESIIIYAYLSHFKISKFF